MSDSVSIDRVINPLEMESAQLVRAISLSNDLVIRTRTYGLRQYSACFSGNEMVDFLVRRYQVTRKQAVRVGQKLLAQNFLHHVAGEHDFQDAPLFYSFERGEEEASKSTISSAAATDIAQEIRQSNGVNAGHRRRWFVDYQQCFRGREVVDWLCHNTGVDRVAALEIGQAMLNANRIRHIFDERPFCDDGNLYRFV